MRRLAEQFSPLNLTLALVLLLTAAGGFLWRNCQLTSPLPAARRTVHSSELVLDYAGVLTPDRGELTRILTSLRDDCDIEAVIVTLDRPPAETSAEELSENLLADWQIGGSRNGRGLLLLISARERKVRLEATAGLSHVYTDRFLRRIQNWPWQRLFSEGDISGAVVRALSEIEKRARPARGGSKPSAG